MIISRRALKSVGYTVVLLLLLQFSLNYTIRYDVVRDAAKVSWENQSFIDYEANRTGPGEQGLPFVLENPQEIEANEVLLAREGFSVLVSDKISLNRALPDMRPPTCRGKKYLSKLPHVSVIITFYNEWFTVLLRCIHSIYNRSPRELLHEIILINDGSTFSDLYEPLENYFNKTFESKVKIHRNEKREGLIKARMIGARLAQADVMIFLDSHMEVTNSWLPPLLEPIVYRPTYATVPIVDSMNHATFAYETIGHGSRGTFDWNFRYQWLPRNEIDELHIADNYELSSMTGGAYAIRREHFFHLGGYDEELKIWNGENYELSLKLWLCSGGILSVPCSRVIHLSKLHTAYRSSDDGSDFSARNLKRVAEVWLDHYKKYFYRGAPKRYGRIDAGDLTKQFELKRKLKCKPFKYFLDVVAPEMLEWFPLEPQYFAAGSVRNLELKQCLSFGYKAYHEPLILSDCSEDLKQPLRRADFTLTIERSIKYNNTNDQCLNGDTLALSNCHHQGANQHWVFNITTRQLFYPYTEECLAGSDYDEPVFLDECDSESSFQKWTWGFENFTALSQWESTGVKVFV